MSDDGLAPDGLPYGWRGERLQSLRKSRGLLQRELGEAMGIDEPNRQARVSNYECNKVRPNAATIDDACVALDCDPNYFFGYPSQVEAD